LLFFAQGHHLASASEPLFSEDLYTTDRGVTLQDTDLEDASPITSEAQLGTISNVIIRYSSLSPADLRTLVQASQPWQLARKAGDDARIERAWLTDWFRRHLGRLGPATVQGSGRPMARHRTASPRRQVRLR
jgi:uncharacterized phage-associated protein